MSVFVRSLWYNIVSTSTSTSVSFHFPFFSSFIVVFISHYGIHIFGLHAVQIMPSREFPIPVAHNKHTPSEEENNNNLICILPPGITHTKSLSSRKQSTYFSIAQSEKNTHTLTVCELCRMHEIS